MKLLVDMNLPPKLADTLNSKGIVSAHWYFIGKPDATDAEIMSYAIQNDFVVITCDLDFSAILSVSHGQKPSVVQLRVQGIDFEHIAELLRTAVLSNMDDLEKGAVLSIDTKKARLRLLPL
jgi:predicted nuclease of predicted toxin-antitoxin system